MIKVKFFTLLRIYLGIDEVEIDAQAIDVRSLLHRVCEAINNDIILQKLLDEKGAMLTGTIILINGKDILEMEKLDTVVRKGDVVSLFTPGGGG